MVFDDGLKTGASFLITLTVTVVVDCKAGLPLSAAAMVTYKIITYILNWDISYSLQKKTIKKLEAQMSLYRSPDINKSS